MMPQDSDLPVSWRHCQWQSTGWPLEGKVGSASRCGPRAGASGGPGAARVRAAGRFMPAWAACQRRHGGPAAARSLSGGSGFRVSKGNGQHYRRLLLLPGQCATATATLMALILRAGKRSVTRSYTPPVRGAVIMRAMLASDVRARRYSADSGLAAAGKRDALRR
jgi:hypothetical protein